MSDCGCNKNESCCLCSRYKMTDDKLYPSKNQDTSLCNHSFETYCGIGRCTKCGASMTDDKKPREFWIVDGRAVVSESIKKPIEADVVGGVHVIEYSAYEALEKELKQFKQFKDFADDDGRVEQSVYESAVKGRRDFRQAFKESQAEIARLESCLKSAEAWHQQSLNANKALEAEIERLKKCLK